MASSHRLASQKNREPRLAVRAVKGTLFSTGGRRRRSQEEEGGERGDRRSETAAQK